MSNFIQITPFMNIDDIDRAVSFFTDVLGFKTLLRYPEYAYLERESVGFRDPRAERPGRCAARESTLCLLY